MDKTILFYKFINIKDPEMAMLWQKELCLRLGLTGRVIVAGQGINGTLGGDIDALRYYKKAMNASGIFRGIHYKWSMVPEGEEIFPRLSVRVRDELVSFGAGDEIKVDDETGVIGGGGRIRADQLHGFWKPILTQYFLMDAICTNPMWESSKMLCSRKSIPAVNLFTRSKSQSMKLSKIKQLSRIAPVEFVVKC